MGKRKVALDFISSVKHIDEMNIKVYTHPKVPNPMNILGNLLLNLSTSPVMNDLFHTAGNLVIINLSIINE